MNSEDRFGTSTPESRREADEVAAEADRNLAELIEMTAPPSAPPKVERVPKPPQPGFVKHFFFLVLGVWVGAGFATWYSWNSVHGELKQACADVEKMGAEYKIMTGDGVVHTGAVPSVEDQHAQDRRDVLVARAFYASECVEAGCGTNEECCMQAIEANVAKYDDVASKSYVDADTARVKQMTRRLEVQTAKMVKVRKEIEAQMHERNSSGAFVEDGTGKVIGWRGSGTSSDQPLEQGRDR